MIKVKDNIYWIGFRDWDAKTFHGHEMSTPFGTSYNVYYVKDEKNAIIDSAKANKTEDYLATIEREIGFDNVDLIVSNHAEPDHAGSIGALLEKVKKDIPIYCTLSGKKFLSKMFGENHNFITVKTNDTISLGKTNLRFIEMKMIHWPDSMMTYVEESKVLLSSDAFGQHYTNGTIFNDDVDECKLNYEALKYYVNILTPFGMLIKKKLEEIGKLNLDIDIIAPGHGVVWKDNPMQIVEKYAKWSLNGNDGSVLVIYDTMYQGSYKMAKAIASGLADEGISYRIFNLGTYDLSDLVTAVFNAKGIVLGGPTLHNGVLSSVAAFLEEIRVLKFKNKCACAFGTYAWSGEACKIIKEGLEKAGFKVNLDPVSVMLKPSNTDLEACYELGRAFSKQVKKQE